MKRLLPASGFLCEAATFSHNLFRGTDLVPAQIHWCPFDVKCTCFFSSEGPSIFLFHQKLSYRGRKQNKSNVMILLMIIPAVCVHMHLICCGKLRGPDSTVCNSCLVLFEADVETVAVLPRSLPLNTLLFVIFSLAFRAELCNWPEVKDPQICWDLLSCKIPAGFSVSWLIKVQSYYLQSHKGSDCTIIGVFFSVWTGRLQG